MREASMGKFEGIREFHEGLAVSDYVNMIPFGETCLDRVGDELMFDLFGDIDGELRGHFLDSHGNIYIAVGSALYRSALNSDGTHLPPQKMITVNGGVDVDFQFSNSEGKVTFCESSVKPTIVFCCDGKYIYLWNTEAPANDNGGERAPYKVCALYMPNMKANGNDGVQPSMMQYIRQSGLVPGLVAEYGDNSQIAWAGSICWFDNKLVMRQSGKTTVWLTCTDPAQFFRDPTLDFSNPPSGFPLWNSWYSSTNSSDTLVDIASFKGQLYFINDRSIEVWGRTGNEDSPIQSNTTQVIHFGGRSPLIVEDELYLICRDSIGHEFVGSFTDKFTRLTNPEIEQRLGTPVDLQLISQRHENFLYVRCKKDSGFLFRQGRWSSWKNPALETRPVVCSVIDEIALALDGSMLMFNEDKRTTNSGCNIDRYIRDGFEQFQRRVIFRRVYIVCDTGKVDYDAGDDKSVYAALSTNRGLNFSQRRYRTFGRAGQNDKVIEWRNLGSGNSVLVEIGTSCAHILQLYDIGIDAQ
jgi:hypothetical protein